MLLVLVVMGAAAAGGFGVCRAIGCNPYPREMLVSAGICTMACLLGLLPLMLLRSAGQSAVAKCAVGATVIHMFLAIVLAGICYAAKLGGEKQPFLLWLLAFYWVSLLSLVGIALYVIQAGQKQGTGKTVP